jgi:transcriptional regulator with XRE-family HTH domain
VLAVCSRVAYLHGRTGCHGPAWVDRWRHQLAWPKRAAITQREHRESGLASGRGRIGSLGRWVWRRSVQPRRSDGPPGDLTSFPQGSVNASGGRPGGHRLVWTRGLGDCGGCETMGDEHHRAGEAIGELLVRLRKGHGYSQDTVAQLLCTHSGTATVTRNEVSRWERQVRVPSAYWLRHLAHVLHVPLEVLREAVAVVRGTPPQVEGDSQSAGGHTAMILMTVDKNVAHVVIRGNYHVIFSVDQFRLCQHHGSDHHEDETVG